jgi:hypothetical protein
MIASTMKSLENASIWKFLDNVFPHRVHIGWALKRISLIQSTRRVYDKDNFKDENLFQNVETLENFISL